MTLTPDEIEHIANSLASAYRSGKPSPDAALHRVTAMADAEEVQEANLRILGDTRAGYALSATSPTTARLLSCTGPVVVPLLRGSMLEDGSTFLLPHGVIGLGAGFCFVLGRPFEDPSDGAVGEREAADACLACYLELHLLGRRVPNGTPLNERTATADLGLDVIHVIGPRVTDWRLIDLASTAISVGLDGNTVAGGRGADTFGSPIGAVAWTARWLGDRGLRLEAGDIVTTGSCTGFVQVAPGQQARAEFEEIGAVSLDLT